MVQQRYAHRSTTREACVREALASTDPPEPPLRSVSAAAPSRVHLLLPARYIPRGCGSEPQSRDHVSGSSPPSL
jgi:hypothetical protein